KELRAIADTGIEVEAFIHGALCYSYSGQCLMSSMIGGRSGNRGRCAGPCRLPYEVLDENRRPIGGEDENYVLSMKDLNTLGRLSELEEAGVCSLKIEGRMKSPLYVAGVTGIYRKWLDKAPADRDEAELPKT
ncbi:MAG: U32 family peptidase, partial [Lachnospiraceae bacterium]|nr:U32 family peptidase [Candidatus Hippenecus merdae]